MHEIETLAVETFQKNIKYFEENHKPIYEKLTLLGQLIDEGIYKERYALEYKEGGYFDLLELQTNEFLYKANSIEAAKRVVEMVDLKRTGAVFKGQKYVYATKAQADEIDKSELSFHNSLWATIKVINYVSQYASPQTYMIRANKIIFLGTGLGLHLKGIVEKFKPKVLFIKEKNIEMFRLSLFVTDYSELAKNSLLYFSLTDDNQQERENFLSFLDRGNNHNLHIKHIPFTDNYQPELQRLQTHVLSQSYISYGYSAMLLRYIDSPRYLVQGYSFLNVSKQYEDNIFSKKPVLLLFSGPSTSKNIEWVKANKEKFIIVSALSTCRLLHKNGITPDIVVHIDPGDRSSLLFEGFDAKEYFKNSVIICSSNVNEETLSKFDSSKSYFIEQGTTYKKGFSKLSAPSVGEYTYGLFLILGAYNMFMLGVDLALDSQTLKSHGELHPFQAQGQIDTKNASLDPRASTEFVKGNLAEMVPTLSPYTLSIMQVKIFTQTLKKEYHQIYNLSDGAYLEGCEPLKFEDYNWMALEPLDKIKIHEEILDFLNQNSSNVFRPEDRKVLEYQVKEAKKLVKLIKQHQKKKFANQEAYLNTLAKLSWDLSDMDYKTKSDLAQVYYEYFSIMTSYVFDLFNTKDLQNPNKHIVQIDAILTQQLLKMSNLYISRLEGYLNN